MSAASVRFLKRRCDDTSLTKRFEMRKTFKYRLFTTRLQSNALDSQLGEACRLYNAALQERRDAWKQRVSISYYMQANQLKGIRAADDLGLANFSCCQDILRRVPAAWESPPLTLPGAAAGTARSLQKFTSASLVSFGRSSRTQCPVALSVLPQGDLLNLVKMRASQINGCAYCLDMHSKGGAGKGRKRAASLRTECVAGDATLYRARTGGARVDRVANARGADARAGRSVRGGEERVHGGGTGGSGLCGDDHHEDARQVSCLPLFCCSKTTLLAVSVTT
jgi:AhpD family alkylhydroperoxidase